MEKLKNLSDICTADSRQNAMVILDSQSPQGFRPLTLEDVYSAVETIKLHNGVPNDLHDHFAMAKNLLVYSWFYYPFNVAAQMQALITTEFALRERAGLNKQPIVISKGRIRKTERTSFARLLKTAVKENWIRDEGFSKIEVGHIRMLRRQEDNYFAWETVSYCQALADCLPQIRNHLAHSSNMLHNWGGEYLVICAELINQLFEVNSNAK